MIHIQGQIRCQYPHQCYIFKIQPLCHHLGTNKDRYFFLVKLSQNRLVACTHRIRIHPQQRRFRKQRPQLLLHPLGTKTDVPQRRSAFRTILRRTLGIPTIMTHQAVIGAVIRQIHAASGTLRHKAAIGAQQLAAAATAVEKQNALLTALQIGLQFLIQRLADGGQVSLPQLLTHIRQDHFGKLPAIIPLPQQGKMIVAVFGVPRRLYRGRGGAQYQVTTFCHGAVSGNIPGMVAGSPFRLIGTLLLLIHDNQAQIFQRRKYRRASPQYHCGLTLPDTLPLVVPFCHAKAAVQQRHLVSEISGEARHHLRCQGDLRYQDHDRLTPLQQLLSQTDIDQCFTAAGDALQQCHTAFSGQRTLQNRLICLLLLII